jgi:hypothetical protein
MSAARLAASVDENNSSSTIRKLIESAMPHYELALSRAFTRLQNEPERSESPEWQTVMNLNNDVTTQVQATLLAFGTFTPSEPFVNGVL